MENNDVIKEIIKEMFSNGTIEVNIRRETEWYDSVGTIILEVKIDEQIVHRSCE